MHLCYVKIYSKTVQRKLLNYNFSNMYRMFSPIRYLILEENQRDRTCDRPNCYSYDISLNIHREPKLVIP